MKRSAKIKLIIVAMIICLLILMAIIINIRNSYISKYGKTEHKNNNYGNTTKQEEPADLYTDTNIKKVQTMPLLLATQDAINKYYGYIYNNNSSAVVAVLDKDYINSNGISTNNVIDKLRVTNARSNFYATKVYSKEISFDHEYKYWVYGNLYTDNSEFYTEQFIVNLDLFNKTFKITPVGESTEDGFENYMDQIIHTDNGEVILAQGTVTSIDENEYNKFSIYEGTEGTKRIIENYAKYYNLMQKSNKEGAYNLLDDEYKNKKFGSLDAYLKSNIMWENINIEYVRQTYNEENIQYIGIDKNGTYYIFYENAPMDYKVMLDSYTVPLEETVKKFNESNSVEQACMCVKNIEEMINNKDYKTMYNHINSVFKQNNFGTQKSFEDYIQNKYYKECKFNFISYKVSEDSYIINVKVVDINSKDESEYFETQYVVKVNDKIGDFEYSFSVE